MIFVILSLGFLFLLTCYFFEDHCSFCKSLIGLFRNKNLETIEPEPVENSNEKEVVTSGVSEIVKKPTKKKKTSKKASKKSKKKKG